MQSIEGHVVAVCRLIMHTAAWCAPGPYRDLLEDVFRERRPPTTGALPWFMLPIFTCEALGGEVEPAQHLAAGLEIGRIAAGCLDEWQDDDTDGALWKRLGPEQTVNLATGLIALSFLAVGRLLDLGTPPALVTRLQQEFHRTLLRMSEGQHADLSNRLSLRDYDAVGGAKSGALFRLGAWAGASVAGAAQETAELYAEFGHELGLVVQLWNDLQALGGQDGKKDDKNGRGLPILAARTLSSTAYEPQSAEAQAGQFYTLVQLQVQHQRAAAALARCPAPGRLTLFLDGFSLQPLVDEARQILLERGKGDAE